MIEQLLAGIVVGAVVGLPFALIFYFRARNRP